MSDPFAAAGYKPGKSFSEMAQAEKRAAAQKTADDLRAGRNGIEPQKGPEPVKPPVVGGIGQAGDAGSAIPRQQDPPGTTSPTSQLHTLSQPHHHHHRPHTQQPGTINPAPERHIYSSHPLPQSAVSTPSQRAPGSGASTPSLGPGYGALSWGGPPEMDQGFARKHILDRGPQALTPGPPLPPNPQAQAQSAVGPIREIPMFGGRNLPSPFESGREAPRPPSGQSVHHRTGSSSSTGPGHPPSVSTSNTAVSPRQHISREYSPPGQSHSHSATEARTRDPQRSPVARAQPPVSAPDYLGILAKIPRSYGPSGFGSITTARPKTNAARANPSPFPSTIPPYGMTAAPPLPTTHQASVAGHNRDRDREAQDRMAREREQMQREQQQREDNRRRAEASQAEQRRAERDEEERRRAAAAMNSNGARPGYPQEPGSLISQVAPVREPRPYNYKAEPLPNNPPTSNPTIGQSAPVQHERDYPYYPREREREREPPREYRSSMDLAVEESTKRSANATVTAVSKRRKKDEGVVHSGNSKSTSRQLPSTTTAPPPRRDWRYLTEVGKPTTPIDDRVVRRWKVDNPNERVYAYEYDGRTIAELGLEREWFGGRVDVRISPGHLGRQWALLGEKGWGSADTLSHGDAFGLSAGDLESVEGMGPEMRWCRAWGTDIYTDDSTIGSMLVHAGYLRWAKDLDSGSRIGEPGVGLDGLLVTLRVLPPMTRYVGNVRNGLKSRAWGNGHDAFSVMVESVKRLPKYSKTTLRETGRKRLKSRVRDFNAQRRAAQGERGPDGEHEQLVFVDDAEKAASGPVMYKYTPDAMVGWLVRGSMRSIWRSSLELKSGEDIFKLTSTNASPYLDDIFPSISLQLQGQDSSYTTRDSSADQYTWTEDGLVVHLSDKRGIVLPIDGYRWIQNTDGVDWENAEEDVDDEVIFDDSAADAGEMEGIVRS